MGRLLSERSFQPTQSISIHCRSEKTSMAFRHLATIFKNGVIVGEGRIPYQNRTWERFEFQSVMQKAVDNADLTPQEKTSVKKWLEGDRTDWSGFKQTHMVASLGDVFGQNLKEKNAWKTRMLKAGLGNQGLDIPDDWSTLPEETKKVRLDKVMDLLGEVGHKNVKKTGSRMDKVLKKNKGTLDVHKETQGWN